MFNFQKETLDFSLLVEELNTLEGVKAWISVSTLYISSKIFLSEFGTTNSYAFNIYNMSNEDYIRLRYFILGLTLHNPV
jgi:hypothetical protein